MTEPTAAIAEGTFGPDLRAFRDRAAAAGIRISQAQIAERMGVSRSRVAAIEAAVSVRPEATARYAEAVSAILEERGVTAR